MTPKRYYTFMIDEELVAALRAAKAQLPDRSEAAIIREALRDWFTKHGVKVKRTARPRKRATRS